VSTGVSLSATAIDVTSEQIITLTVGETPSGDGTGGGSGTGGGYTTPGSPRTGARAKHPSISVEQSYGIIGLSVAVVSTIMCVAILRSQKSGRTTKRNVVLVALVANVLVISTLFIITPSSASGILHVETLVPEVFIDLNQGESTNFQHNLVHSTTEDTLDWAILAEVTEPVDGIDVYISSEDIGLDATLLPDTLHFGTGNVDHDVVYDVSIDIHQDLEPGEYSISITYTLETTEQETPLATCLPSSTSGINVNLSNNMIPVVYDEAASQWVKADQTNRNAQYRWHDYRDQVWANAVTVKEGGVNSRGYYLDASPGEPVLEDDILTFMVYIPRYEYTIYSGAVYAGGTQTQPKCIDVRFVSSKADKVLGSAGYSTPGSPSGWRTHPAFTFGTEELDGIWVSKFTVSPDPDSTCYTTMNAANCNISSIAPRVKPNARMWVFVNYYVPFVASQNMQLAGNIYGYDASADVHMMKNSEWGAVVYLSQSVFGKWGNPMYTGVNEQVYMNKDGFPIRAGMSNGTPSQTTTNTQCPYDTITNRGGGTGGCGSGASTTGNISGVYDMSGGAWTYVMGVHTNQPRSSGFLAAWFTDPANAKYYDYYAGTSAATGCDGGICYGHALSEVAQWYGDRDLWITTSAAWVMRGGYNTYAPQSGIFAYSSTSVVVDNVHGFRIVHP